MFRKDAKLASGAFEWIFIQYVPEHATVREKMLYASTKVSLSKDLGDSNFSEYIYATVPEDVTLNGYCQYVKHSAAEAPLTEREQELQNIKRCEVNIIHR